MKMHTLVAEVTQKNKELARTAVSNALVNYNSQIEALFQQLDQGQYLHANLSSIKNKYSKFALVGIGGSCLGIQVFSQFFARTNFKYFDNVDAVEFESQIAELGGLGEVFWIFTSKSGETIETLATMELVEQIYFEQNLNLKNQCLVITENKPSSLNIWAQERSIQIFEVPLAIGGRYSALSFVGLVPAYLMGLDISALAEGAKKAKDNPSEIENFVAASLSSFEREEWITVLWNYSSRLRYFGLWWEQLWAESLGKDKNLNGENALRVSTPISLVGATDQHSVLQQVNEGYKDKLVVFLRSKASESGSLKIKNSHTEATKLLKGLSLGQLLKAEAIATQKSLTESKVPNLTLEIDQFDEATLAEMMMFMQISVLAIGQALNLNPLNQPGVERGKVLCKSMLLESNQAQGVL